MRNSRPKYRLSREAVQISMSLPGAFKPVYVDTDVRSGDRAQRLRYQRLFVDGGMLNNYPIHAFDHIEYTGSPTPGAAFLSGITYRGLPGEYPIAGDPKLRQADCNCVLGMRLQEKPKQLERIDKEKIYPNDKGVLLGFLKNMFGTLMYGSEEGQIRSVGDEERTVELYATIYEKYTGFSGLKRELKLDDDATEYSLAVADFSTPAIDRTRQRGRKYLAQAKIILMKEAGEDFKRFLTR